jgi:hypothetical protein
MVDDVVVAIAASRHLIAGSPIASGCYDEHATPLGEGAVHLIEELNGLDEIAV